jgi:hypothetical protein
MDPGIVDTVVALRLLGFTTQQSCEGHVRRGDGQPWVRLGTVIPPEVWESELRPIQRRFDEPGCDDVLNDAYLKILDEMIARERELTPAGEYERVARDCERLRELVRRFNSRSRLTRLESAAGAGLLMVSPSEPLDPRTYDELFTLEASSSGSAQLAEELWQLVALAIRPLLGHRGLYALRVRVGRLNRRRRRLGLVTPFRPLRLWLTRREMRAFTLFLVAEWARQSAAALPAALSGQLQPI